MEIRYLQMYVVKMRSHKRRVGPGVLIQTGNSGTDTSTGRISGDNEGRVRRCFYKPRNAKDCQ